MHSLTGGGAERTVVNIINNLERESFEVVLVLGSKKNNDYIDFVSKDIKVKYLNCDRLRYCLLKLKKSIKEEKPDLLFSTLNNNNIILLLAKIFTLKKIPTFVRETNNRTQSGKSSKLNKLVTYILYNFVSNKVIALSKGVKEDLYKNFHINNKKIEVIYNPIEVEKIKKISQEMVEDTDKVNGEKLIIAVGRLVEQKDFYTLIEAFNLVSKEVNAKLLILGKGPLENDLKDLSKKLGINDRIVFLGFNKNPYKYMKGADVFALSSKWEGFGHVIVEAMATGTPVISTECKSGPAEIIKNNKYGILVPVGNYELLAKEITQLLSNEEMRKYYSNVGLMRADDFNAKNIVKEYEQLFMIT